MALLTGTVSGASRKALLGQIGAGHIDLVVGTHAIVQDDVKFKAIGLAVVDEQHRFGVLQRATLRAKGLRPDMLVMTATPIPRTLALTTYGDLDVSSIRELPPGRQPVRTIAKPDSRRDEIYAYVRTELEAGRQVYVVYPIIEESEKIDVRAATEMADHLANEVFPAYRVALLHGRMKQDAKDRVMRAFAAGDIHVLVSTTVVEVGVDVANAAVMLVWHAERFGLAQLHQLRGRVGTRRASVDLRARLPVSAQRSGARAAEGADRDERRVRDRREGSRAARLRRSLGHAAVGAAGAAARRSAARPRADGRGARGRGTVAGRDRRTRHASTTSAARWGERFGLVEVG